MSEPIISQCLLPIPRRDLCPCMFVQAELQRVLSAVEVLQRKCDQVSTEKAYLEAETERTRTRLIRAEKLTTGLASEGVRWKREAVVVAEQVRFHTSSCLPIQIFWVALLAWAPFFCPCLELLWSICVTHSLSFYQLPIPSLRILMLLLVSHH